MSLESGGNTPETSENDKQVCRLCLSVDGLNGIFDQPNVQYWIRNYLSITVSEADTVSQLICTDCRTRLEDFHGFRQRCVDAQSELCGNVSIRLECDVCAKVFPVKRLLMKHKKLHGLKKHKCDICGANFRQRSRLAQHMKIHDRLLRTGTDDQEKEVLNRSETNSTVDEQPKEIPERPEDDLDSRSTSEHPGSRILECEKCDKKFKVKKQLMEHLKVHTRKSHPCTVCGKSFTSTKRLDDHMLIHKSVIFSKSEMDISEPEHKSTVHSTEVQKMQVESQADELTTESESLLETKDIKAEIETRVEAEVPSSSHSAITDDDRIPRNSTNDMPQEVHNPSEKEHDSQNASDTSTSVDQVDPRPSDTTLECEKCHKKFKMRRQKMDHLRLVHASKNHKCNHCDSSFVSKQRLNKHMIVHDTSTNINKDFSEPEDTYTEYDRMSRIIVFEKKECPLCNRMIKLPFLEGHLNRHKGVQPFECKMGCMEKFRCKIERNTHYRDVHGWKAHRCDFCQQYFHSHRSCILHKAKVHSSGFKCQECFTAFASRSGLHRHMMSTKHSNDNSGIQIAQVEPKAEEPKSSFEAAVKTDEAAALPISSLQPKEVHNDEHNPQNASEPKPCGDQVDTKVIQYFQCKMGCVEKFRSKFRRNVHYCDVHEWKAHQCEICLQRFPSHRSYVMHKAKVHSSGYRCQNCPTVFASRSGLHRHRRNAEYTKGICGIQIAQEESQVNKPTAEPETLPKAKDIKVEIETDEESELPLSSWLHRHNSETQIVQIESQATEPEKTAEPESLFEAEDIKVEVETDEEAELRNSSHSAKDMSTDDNIFRNNSMIDKPKEIHNHAMGEHNPENSSKPKACVDQVDPSDPTNECEKCGKQFKWRRQLMDHRRLVHAARDHKCTICEKLFLSKKKLDAHMYVHKLLPATEADMDISEPEQTHEVYDSAKRGYVVTKKACLVCNRKIKLAFMEGHLYRHKGVKPFKCKMGCTEKFYCKFKRKSHYHKAHGWKSYKCDICQQYFPSHRSCILHKAKAHSFGFKCLECLAVFASSSGLYRHMRNTKHSNGDSGIQLMQMEDLATEQAAEAESLFEAEDIKLEIETDEEAEIPSRQYILKKDID